MLSMSQGRYGLVVAFPSHKGEYGTCDFMSEKCSRECPDFVTQREIDTLLYFESHTDGEISMVLVKEMAETKSTILSWFNECGDCPKRLTKKIVSIISYLSDLGISQNGFTRNKEFWESLNGFRNIHICLTEENEKIANSLLKKGLVAVPNYETCQVSIGDVYLCGGGIVITCGEASVIEGDEVYEEDCSLCHKRKSGCYKVRMAC